MNADDGPDTSSCVSEVLADGRLQIARTTITTKANRGLVVCFFQLLHPRCYYLMLFGLKIKLHLFSSCCVVRLFVFFILMCHINIFELKGDCTCIVDPGR